MSFHVIRRVSAGSSEKRKSLHRSIIPNIAAIYDLQEADNVRFLVLELVEGETLAERIQRGPIPVEETLDIARHICEALEAAHEKGIVHRDLKPTNVKITSDGRVKVLDFGLAKAMENSPASGTLSNSPTLTIGATQAGVILGRLKVGDPVIITGNPTRTEGEHRLRMVTFKRTSDGLSWAGRQGEVVD